MNLLDEVRRSDKKPKELVAYLAGLLLKEPLSAGEFASVLSLATDSERGTCVEALEVATQTDPEVALPHLSAVIARLEDKAPRVRWEAARVVGNLAGTYPMDAGRAVDGLFKNTSDKSTVVRWSAAFALGEIMKHNRSLRESVLKRIEPLLEQEQNSGVKNVYLKALKSIKK